ncbi:FecR domain-containing protein [Sandaracinobacter sp. RS1-74]|uniref:FecR family protein n=1 Tax=Sandaracinobacteroides sayramensis TaxID=2913411 RepID=UPI001EDBC3AC|nr:FecR domain-containing protein [Sandaracinobacteroides sayramensis]MCG2840688.1 FecR domain-containing protein [Sandaracinobacteroides sayramensis]
MTGPDEYRSDGLLPDRALEEASDWLLRIEDAPADAALRAELEAWLAADADNAKAWALAHRTVRLSRLADAGERAAAVPAPPNLVARRFARSGPRYHPARHALAAMAAAVAVIVIAPDTLLRLRGGHASSTAETRALRLADGSTVILGADSAIIGKTDAGKREIALLRGEAWFDVAHGNGRPFVVRADDMTVTVTGTAFDVAMTDRTLSVGLARGSVRVARPGQPAVEIAMKPGQRVAIDRASGAAAATTVDLPEIGAWRSGRLAVRNANFSDVVAALDRYHAGVILVRGERLASARVTGVYDLADPAGSLRTLAWPASAQIWQITPWLTIVSGD